MVPMRTQSSINGLNLMCQYLAARMFLKKSIMVEIGSYTGDSALVFSKYFLKVVCIDPWENGLGGINNVEDMENVFNIFKKRTEGIKNIFYYRMTSERAINMFDDKSQSFVYIDGSHFYKDVKNDITMWLPKIKSGCFIGGHDYTKKFQDVIRAVNETIGVPDKTFNDTSFLKGVK